MLQQENKLINITLAYFLCFYAILTAVNSITHVLFGESFKIGTYLVFFTYFFLLLLTILKMNKGLSLGKIFFTLFVIESILFSLAISPIQNYVWTGKADIMGNPTYNFVLYALMGFILSDYLENIDDFFKKTEKFASFTIVLSLIQHLLIINKGKTLEYMSFSYNILFSTLFVWILLISNFKWNRLFIGLMGMCMILFAGCRGALVCLLAGICLYIVFAGKMSGLRRLVLTLLLFSAIIIVFNCWEDILSYLITVANKMEINSRTLVKLKEANFFDDSGRSLIQNIVKDNIEIFPKGLYADRVCSGSYSHNIFLEILISYGYFGGLILMCMMMMLFYRAFKHADKQYRMLFIALFASGFTKLLFSGSFMGIEPCFYVFLGVCMNVLKIRKHELKTSQNYNPVNAEIDG